jgi:anti-sigma B factor antagonist
MMTPSSTCLKVAVADSVVFLKIAGRACFSISVDLKNLVEELRGKGCTAFVLDLSQCSIMDSTILGMLTGLSLKLEQLPHSPSTHYIRLLNPNDRISALLDNLGVATHFQVSMGVSPERALAEIIACRATPAELAATSLEAHETLMAVNPDNIPKFKDVAQFLAEDIRNFGQQSPG